MKRKTIVMIVLSHIAVGGGSFYLGSTIPSDSVTMSTRTETGALGYADSSGKSPGSNSPSVMPKPESSPLSSDFSVGAAAEGQGMRQRIATLLRDIESMDSKQVLESLKKIRHQPGSPDKMLAQQMLLARFGELDPETALTYVETLSGTDYEMSGLTVMNAWTEMDPESAATHYSENLDDFGILDDHQRVMAGAVAADWARTDPEAALEWVDQLPTEVRGEAYGRVVAQLVAEDPGQALAVRDTMDADFERTEMTQTIVDQWAYQDPEAAASWLTENTAGDEQAKAAASLMKAWMTDDPVSASTWLGEMDNGPTKDSAIVALTESRAANGDPEAALVWTGTIENVALREQTFRETAAKWLKSDPAAAQTWLRANSADSL